MLLLVVRLGLAALGRRGLLTRLSPVTLIGLALVGITLAATLSDLTGLHTVIGPLLLGAAVPRHLHLGEGLERSLGDVARAVLLPFFFLTVGLGVDTSALSSPLMIVALLLVAVVGKLGGALAGATLTGSTWFEAWRLGVLLNTRGLTELVFLASGSQLGIIRPALYTALVVVTLVTTVATAPLLDLGATGIPLSTRPRHG